MIRSMRRKFTLLVIVTLLVIISGTVMAINYGNWTGMEREFQARLELLLENEGKRPDPPRKNNVRPGNGGGDDGSEFPPPPKDRQPGQPHSDASSSANLSNSYTVKVDHDGAVTDWYSDRMELYTAEQVSEAAALALASGEDEGRVGSQYFRLESHSYGKMIAFLDGRLEMENARRLLLISSLSGLAAYLLLSIGSALLVRRITRPVQEAFDQQRQFVWDASHELKTPLAVISANAEVLAGEIGENRWLDCVQSEVERSGRLIQNLLTLAGMERPDRTIPMCRFDLGKALLEVALPFESVAFEAGKSLSLDIPENIFCKGNREMCQQLAVILLDNAMKYTAAQGEIDVSLRAKNGRCVFSVRNTGDGIVPEDLPKIFNRFYRAELVRGQTEGSGLGLAIARSIVDTHRGKLTVQSQQDQWTCFKAIL